MKRSLAALVALMLAMPVHAATVCRDEAATSLDFIDGKGVEAEMPTRVFEIRKLQPDEQMGSPCFFKLEVMDRSLVPTDHRDGWANACYNISANGRGVEAAVCLERWKDDKVVQVTCEGTLLNYGFQPDGEFYTASTGVVAHEYRDPGSPLLLKPTMSVGYCSSTP